MRQPFVYLIIGAVIAGAAIVGFQAYQDSRVDAGVEISIGEGGVTLEKK